MKPIVLIVGILIGLSVVVGILYVFFGQTTVRKLRKNPETKDALGIEFASGWDILNVAKAFAMPKVITRKWKKSPQSAFYADIDLLFKHTSKFDRYLGTVFYWVYAFTGFSAILTVLLDVIGVFD